MGDLTGKLFLSVLNMSIAAGWTVMAVILLRVCLRKVSRRLICVLWAVVAVRSICPVMPESSFSLVPSAQMIPVEGIYSTHSGNGDIHGCHLVESGIRKVDEALRPAMEERGGSRLKKDLSVLAYLWIGGVFLLLSYALVSLAAFRRKMREAIPLRDNILLCDAVSTPLVFGCLRPRIYLPSDIPPEQTEYVLAHERAHIKRRDNWWKPLGYLLAAIYWFHPLAWAAYILLCRDIELACDEKVICGLNLAGRKKYSEALLACSMKRRVVYAFPMGFGTLSVKLRIKSVLSYKKPAVFPVLAAGITCLLVLTAFATDPIPVVKDGSGMGELYDSELVETGLIYQHAILLKGEQTVCEVYDDYVRDGYVCPLCGETIVVGHWMGERNHSKCGQWSK